MNDELRAPRGVLFGCFVEATVLAVAAVVGYGVLRLVGAL